MGEGEEGKEGTLIACLWGSGQACCSMLARALQVVQGWRRQWLQARITDKTSEYLC